MDDDTPTHERIDDLLTIAAADGFGNDTSEATTPGEETEYHRSDREDKEVKNMTRLGRTRPRVFPYAQYLPYATESSEQRTRDMNEMIKHLYIAVASGDFQGGAVHWTKEIRGWMGLKFDLTKHQRISLVKLYYELSMAPGLDFAVAERFASMFMVLTKRKHYLRPGKDLTLDWRPLFREIKVFVLPYESSTQNTYSSKRSLRTLTKLCTFAQLFFDPKEIPSMLEEFLPFFSLSFAEHAFVVISLINLMLPTAAPPADQPKLHPQYYLPTFFHLWSTVNRSSMADTRFLDIFSRMARDCLGAEHIPFGPFGLFDEAQSSQIFTAILRVLEIPVGQATSAHSGTVDVASGSAILLDRDPRKHPVSHGMARWIVMSLSPHCLQEKNTKSVLHQLEGLIQGVETFFHPSNSGSWTKTLSQLVYYLADFFVMRWNREQSGEYDIPAHRKLNAAIKHRFVLCLRPVVFMGIFAKSGTAVNYSLSCLQSLAYLEPNLILPGALQRIYPAMQGLVEVHRTISSIRTLQMLSRIIATTKGFRCHLTTLLGLALPGVDANDLDKTMHSLAFIQSVCYNIPLVDLTKEPKNEKGDLDGDDEAVDRDFAEHGDAVGGTALAVEWITAQVARFEQEGPDIEVDYSNELSDEEEEAILKSSTAGFAEFVISLLGRVFTLLQNLPDAARVKSGSPEENVVNTLPATFSPLLASLSPELYDIALEQVARFIGNHVVHQARDAMAFICNALVKISPKKALARLLPDLIASIRTEISENNAASTRTTGSEILPRDRALVWHVSLLSMCIVHVGRDVIEFQEELFGIANFMQDNCKGIPLTHVSNFVHHLLLNLTVTYTIDYSLYNKSELERGLTANDWGRLTDPTDLEIQWHVPDYSEIQFAVRVCEAQAGRALNALNQLISETATIKRDGVGKDWSDEVCRNLVLLRLVISGMSRLFRSNDTTGAPRVSESTSSEMDDSVNNHGGSDTENSGDLWELDENQVKRVFTYPTGYPLEIGSKMLEDIHKFRQTVGETLHKVHMFLIEHQEDDVACFNSLYTAYKSWFVDIGIERSAHVLDRLTRLLGADQHPFKYSGTRKQYPRPLLIRRANLYHFQRLRFNEHPRVASELDKALLLDLAHSCTSIYTEVRRTAQSAEEQAVKSIIGAKTLIIPPLLDALEAALKKNDHSRIKGAIFSLLFGSLAKPIGRNWKAAPRMIRLFTEVIEVDRPSVQRLAGQSTFTIQAMTSAMDRMVILDEQILKNIWPTDADHGEHTVARTVEEAETMIQPKKAKIKKLRVNVEAKKEELARELVSMIKDAHWKKASRTAIIAIGLDYRYEKVASEGMLELVVNGVIDSHPQLRTLYGTSLTGIFSLLHARALTGHTYEKYILDEQIDPDTVSVATERDDPTWTDRYLQKFANPMADVYLDSDHPGWLVWNPSIRGFRTGASALKFDEVESDVRKKIGSYIDRHWLSTLFGFMKQEPRDESADRFRMRNSMIVAYAIDLIAEGKAKATLADFKDLMEAVYGDGNDKHQHRTMAEIMGALITSSEEFTQDMKKEVWEFVFPILRRIFNDGLTPENSQYWSTFITMIVGGKDPRRFWPLIEWLASFRLDMDSNAAFKESSKIVLLHIAISSLGWHFQLDKPITEDFLAHLDHPYKGVREVMATTLSTIFRTRYHESYKDITTLLEDQKAAGSVGTRPYQPTDEFTGIMRVVFERLEKWRLERPPGTQTPTQYTQASKTVLLWLDTSLSSFDCTTFVPFFPHGFMEQLLHMMDIKEDPELQSLAYHVFRHLPNIPHRPDEADDFIASLIRIGKESKSWHQRLRVLINIQVFYFRHLFLMSPKQMNDLFLCAREMLHDTQHEVCVGAATTLGGMVRCSPVGLRVEKIDGLKTHFTKLLINNTPAKRGDRGAPGARPNGHTEEQSRVVRNRHAAVLGLGALVQAFPYASPPPVWLPEVLATLAGRAANDPGVVGKAVKNILSDFKKTRQDTWQIDMKAFTPEQLEDLEGVLWKSYFA